MSLSENISCHVDILADSSYLVSDHDFSQLLGHGYVITISRIRFPPCLVGGHHCIFLVSDHLLPW
jgi:hypothetical protein